MSITQTLGEIGTWSARLRPTAPGRLISRATLGDYPLIIITAARVPAPVAASINRPLFRGIITAKDGPYSLSGVDLAWYLGTPAAADDTGEVIQADGFGGRITKTWTAAALATTMADITAVNGLSYDIEPGLAATITGQLDGTPRSGLDRLICPQSGASWRMRHDNTVELFTAATAAASPVAVITDQPGETDLDILTWQVGDAAPQIDWAATRNRAIIRYTNSAGNPATHDATIGAGFRAYGGATLDLGHYASSSITNPGMMGAETSLIPSGPVESVSLEVVTPTPTSQLTHPDTALGSTVGVYLPDTDIIDHTNPTSHRGRTIYPVPLRITEHTTQLTEGMGVYLDWRWNGPTYRPHAVTDLTDWIEWEATTASTSTRLELGAIPRSWTA